MSSHHPPSQPPRPSLIILAFAAIYLIWGSTYLAMRIAIETIPPFAMAAARFLIAGCLMFGLLRAAGAPNPTLRQWKNSFITGLLLLLGGNGLVVYGEKTVNSSLAALLIATAPVWFSLLEWLRPGGSPPKQRTIVGIVVSFIGIVILIGWPAADRENRASLGGMAIILFACFCWAAGSMFSKHSERTASPWVGAASQMVCGGLALLAVSVATGERQTFSTGAISARSAWALAYLIVCGSWIAFSAYVWLLKVSTPARVSTYAFVNPVIAVFLGWALAGEAVTIRMLIGSGVIVGGVVVITLSFSPRPRSKIATSPTGQAFTVIGRPMGLRETIDPAHFNKGADDLEAEAVLEKLSRSKQR